MRFDREHAWEQCNIPGGAIRFNELDWEVLMLKGRGPINPPFYNDHTLLLLRSKLFQAWSPFIRVIPMHYVA